MLNGPLFMLGNSTNSTLFKRFLEEVKWCRTDDPGNDFWLIIDGKIPPIEFYFTLFEGSNRF